MRPSNKHRGHPFLSFPLVAAHSGVLTWSLPLHVVCVQFAGSSGSGTSPARGIPMLVHSSPQHSLSNPLVSKHSVFLRRGWSRALPAVGGSVVGLPRRGSTAVLPCPSHLLLLLCVLNAVSAQQPFVHRLGPYGLFILQLRQDGASPPLFTQSHPGN